MSLDKSQVASSHFKGTPKTSLTIAKLLHRIGLVYIWRETDPTSKDYTHSLALHATYAKIDHIFVSSTRVPFVYKTHIRETAWSDCPLVCLVLSQPMGPTGSF